MKKIAICSMLAMLLLVCGCGAALVFVSDRDGHDQIYSMADNGFNQRNLSNNDAYEHSPDLSPDGTKIVFSSFRNPPGENIYIMDLDGRNVRQVTTGTGQRARPRWAPNGLIAFAYPAYTGKARIWTIRSDGTGLAAVTSPGPDESDDSGHDFYDAGRMIVFSRWDRATQRRDLYAVKSDGTRAAQRITNTPDVSEVDPVVSHDGRLLAYRAYSHSGGRDSIRIVSTGTWAPVREITLQPPADINISGLSFRADDQGLYVSVQASGIPGTDIGRKQEIFSIGLDGQNQRRLTNNEWRDTSPAAIAPTRQGGIIPVLFVHGHSGGKDAAWENPGSAGTTSFKAALEANPTLPIRPVYLSLPLHGSSHPENFGRSIADDATDILAAIEGGNDSNGRPQTGILNDPAYGGATKVALVGYSQGAISSRYYLKNLMGSRKNGAITVSEFVALAAPTHGVGGSLSCGNENEPDRSTRQLCGGMTATAVSQLFPCGSCPSPLAPFTTNLAGDQSFLNDLNGHDFRMNCNESAIPAPALEAPRSRPGVPDGVLYVNLYAAGNADLVVGGHTQSLDCLGRRLARNHAPDVFNMEITGVPAETHSNFPHHWPTICVTLQTIVNHQAPASQADACRGLAQP
ncbi:MAG: alpha/beta fold hydrolase [Syntrophaceae bacterium]|nr:alpha/beta fold hydrolase [Syntrophaceae bacterium]